MNRTFRKIEKAYQNAQCIPIHSGSRMVFMSDCHRGVGNWGDNFQQNQNLFFAALQYYHRRRFTYIELGDGDELWENRKLKEIIQIHGDQFRLMSELYRENRFHMIYGNHDRKKGQDRFFGKVCNTYYCENEGVERDLFPGMKVQEAIRLQDSCDGQEIFLVHGHQGDLWNDTLWKLSRFLVRYVWRRLELAGCNDPTSTAKNYHKKEKTEKKLAHWAEENKKILIAGHTHRPVFPKPGKGYYFNDGCCVHPRCITAMELERGALSLVKWSMEVREDNLVYIGRQVLEGPVSIKEYR